MPHYWQDDVSAKILKKKIMPFQRWNWYHEKYSISIHKPGIFNYYIRMYNAYLRTYIVVVVVMVFNATFNNISAISWWSVILVEETGVPRENHRPAASHWQTLSHNVGWSNLVMSGIRPRNFRLGEIYIDVYCHIIDKMT